MKGEINKDWYCSSKGWDVSFRQKCIYMPGCFTLLRGQCYNAHRKWPTPEQFKEEYGEDWKGGVYIYFDFKSEFESKWELRWYYERGYFPNSPMVCACTPWGKPPNDWRPE